MEINIAGKDKAQVLAALYNNSKPQGMGFLHFDAQPMTVEEARELLKETTSFDYLKGRVMKVELGQDILNTRGYDRDNGEGAALRAIESAGVMNTASLEELQQKYIQETKGSNSELYAYMGSLGVSPEQLKKFEDASAKLRQPEERYSNPIVIPHVRGRYETPNEHVAVMQHEIMNHLSDMGTGVYNRVEVNIDDLYALMGYVQKGANK